MIPKWHIRPGLDGGIGQCGTTEETCPFGTHFDNPIDAKAEADRRKKWAYDNTLNKKGNLRDKSRVGRKIRDDDPPIIWENYKPLSHPDREAERRQRRYVGDDEDPNMRHLDDEKQRYYGAQERSIRMSSLTPEETEMAMEHYFSPGDGLIRYEVPDDQGSTIQYCFDKQGRLHWTYGFAHRDHELKARYYQGIVHADEEEEGPAVVLENGNGEFYIRYGLLHRQHGPAVITPTSVEFWREGLRHRVGGPAVLSSDGEQQFWEQGVFLSSTIPEEDPPASFMRTSRELWDDPRVLSEAEYQEYNCI